MAITWTKEWAASDDGTIITGADLENIQNDIESSIGDATKFHGKPFDSPEASDDGLVIFWDNTNEKYDYVEVVKLAGNQTVEGDKTFNGDIDFTASLTAEYLKIDEQSAAPSTAANQMAIYPKLVGSQSEFFIREESDGDEIQLTNAGRVNGSGMEIFTANGSWTAPAGVNYVAVSQCGGGGGGAGDDNGEALSGGGGGGGAAIISHIMVVTPGNSYTITVGAGGAGGAAGDNPGAAGGSSTFVGDTSPSNYTLTTAGGAGGLADSTGGAGGAGSSIDGATTTEGELVHPGGNGGDQSGNLGGGGGGSRFGRGGDNASPGGVGGIGAGGGGANRSNAAGGDGGDGIVILRYGTEI